MTSLKSYLAATAAFLAFGVASAQATPYAYGVLNFSNFGLTGVLDNPGVTINSSTVTTSSSANYASASPDAASAPGTLTGGSNVRQSVSGPGPFPPQDTYTQALQALSGTRADSRIVGSLAGGALANDVAEGRLTLPSTTAASSAGTTTGINLSVTTTARETFTLSFNAADTLIATTGAAGDGASTEVNASFAVNGTAISFAPSALNQSVTASGVGGNNSFTSPDTPYSFTFSLNPGTYQFSLLSGAQERLETGAAIPEPVSLALVGSGLIGMGLIRRRRRS